LHGAPTGKGEENWRETFSMRFSMQDQPERATALAWREFAPDVVYVHKLPDLRVLERLLEYRVPLVRMVHDHDIYCMRSYKYFYGSRAICTRSASLYCVFGCGAFLGRNHGPGLPIKYVSYSNKKREIALNHRFDRAITVSNYMREQLVANGFNRAKVEIHPPIPPPGDPALRSNFSERNLIIYAGQIIRGKGVDVLIESLAHLKNPFECIILGEGSHRAYCEKLTGKLGLSDRIHFKGFVPQEELKNYFRECSVVALSSVWPVPIATIGLEVMGYALPVVAFDAGGISDWLHDGVNGFLIPWMDRRAFAGALDRLLSDKALAKQFGEQGLRIVNEKYHFNSYIEGLEDLFERVIAEKNEASARPAQYAAVPA
jgi:glycosyltransferase involved in cell wall biosynthesis